MNSYTRTLNDRIRTVFEIQGTPVPSGCNGNLITDHLIAEKRIEPDFANMILQEATGVSALDPSRISFSKSFLDHATRLIPKNFALSETVFPVRHENRHLTVVMANPGNVDVIKRLEYLAGSAIEPHVCHSLGIIKSIKKWYRDVSKPETEADVESLIRNALNSVNRKVAAKEDWSRILNDLHVIRMVREMLDKMVEMNASDLHFEPWKETLRIRCRIDGVLITMWEVPFLLGKVIIRRIKLIAGLDLSEDRIPLDGAISINLFREREADIRVSTLPGLFGEKIVLRILKKGGGRLTLTDLGLDPEDEKEIRKIVTRPNGLILVTGPTGSGKTTTLYAILQELNRESVNIVTAEDPVEYQLPGITQVTCSREGRLDFATALKAFLRQDPDIVMVGEIRDPETAETAVHAAMTGHLVFSTVHTNDAVGAVARLTGLGVRPDMLAAAGLSVIAQRLLRRICPDCAASVDPDPATAVLLSEKGITGPVRKGTGCHACGNRGYRGRVGVFEIFRMNDEIEQMVMENAPTSGLKETARKNGMRTLRESAVEAMIRGITTGSEVLRVTEDE